MRRRRKRNQYWPRPKLSEVQILAWAEEYYELNGRWPRKDSGWVPGGPERWSAISSALQKGCRGLRGGSSLARLLPKRRGVRNRRPQQIIPNRGGERWSNIDQALRKGLRWLKGGSSLPKLLAKHRGVPNLKKGMAAHMSRGKRATSRV